MGKIRLTVDEFIKRAIIVHGYKYSYEKVVYTSLKNKVDIICKDHGVFKQLPTNHLKGQTCPECSRQLRKVKKLSNILEFIEKANKKHKNYYDYSGSEYVNAITKLKIKCKNNHIFWQKPAIHLSGSGCPKCFENNVGKWNSKDNDFFLLQLKGLDNDQYNYSLVKYEGWNTKIKIICDKHGIFNQTAGNHLKGQGCPKCVNKISKAEQEIYEFIKSIREDSLQSNRTMIKPYELDIYIPSLNLAFEYNGKYWHSEKFRPSDHREKKSELCKNKGINLIHIEEEYWLKNKQEVKNKIKQLIIK